MKNIPQAVDSVNGFGLVRPKASGILLLYEYQTYFDFLKASPIRILLNHIIPNISEAF
jgi:hypothetical protein